MRIDKALWNFRESDNNKKMFTALRDPLRVQKKTQLSQ